MEGVKKLFHKGDRGLLSKGLVRLAVVGSRRMSEYGRRVIEEWVPVLVQNGVVTVSGMMYGVDEAAHRQTLVAGGKTIGIAGWGIDWSGDNTINDLSNKILQGDGLILSEYKGETVPQLWMFPQRNRWVAGISRAVLVVEAGEGSGSLITARWGRRFKKKVLAVPGPISSKVSRGTNWLIKTGQAKMVTSAEEVLAELKIVGTWSMVTATGSVPVGTAGRLEGRILAALEAGPKTVDDLADVLREPVEKLAAGLSFLELEGRVKLRGGLYYI